MSIEWENCKKILTPLVMSGEIPNEWTPNKVFNLAEHREVFQKMNGVKNGYAKFQRNLRELRKRVMKWKAETESDEAAFAHDKALYPTDPSKPRWPGSDAEFFLRQDVDEGIHKLMKPADLQKTRECYQVFQLDQFRNHIYQECRKRLESPYWRNVRLEKEKERERKKSEGKKLTRKEKVVAEKIA